MKMDKDLLISYYEEARQKAHVCLGFDDDIDVTENNDDARQIIAFVTKELNDYLFVNSVEVFDLSICKYLKLSGNKQLIKILDVLNYFK